MQTVLSLCSILAVLAIGIVSPGPSFLLVARTSVAVSRGAGVAAALGTAAGACVLAIAALLGLGTLLRQVPAAFLALKLGGGLYLLWLAVRTWRGADAPLALTTGVSPEAGGAGRPGAGGRRHFLSAFATLLGNPKAAIMYGVIFAALLPPAPTNTLRVALPPSIFVLEGAWYLLVVLALSAPRTRGAYLRAKGVIDRVCGIVFGLLGVRLLRG